ncbi:hypothetical protein ACIQC0_01965 [Pseudarthrobacter sp. NPDC092419]|uniref:hypothetical protein n=1 Tax=Pseudarthrobacter sp. NPDC092419 TaxID=3364414 RepID=UPI00381ED903
MTLPLRRSPAPPGAFTVTAAVHSITWRIWFNDLARSLGSPARAKSLLIGIGAAMAAWTAWSSVELGRQLGLDAESGWQIAGPVAGVMFTMPALATLMAVLYAPSRTLLTEMLSVLPVRQAHTRAAVRWLTVAVGLCGGLLIAAPLALQFAFAGSVRVAVIGLSSAVYAALLGALTTQVLVEVTQVAGGRLLGRNTVIIQGISGLAVAALLLLAFIATMPLNGRESGGPLRPLGDVLAWLLGGPAPSWWAAAVAFGLPVLLIVALRLLESAPRPDMAPWRPGLRLRFRARAAHDDSLFRLELLQWIRYPSNAVLLLFINGLCIAAVVSAAAAGADDLGLTYVALAVASSIGIGCYGPTRRHHWIYRIAGSPTAWVAPKFMAVVAVWSAMMAIYGTALVLLTGWEPFELVMTLPMLFVELCASCIVGLVLPVSRDQSIGGAVSEAVALIGLIGLTFSAQSVLAMSANLLIGVLLQLLMMAAVATAYFAIGRKLALRGSDMAEM